MLNNVISPLTMILRLPVKLPKKSLNSTILTMDNLDTTLALAGSHHSDNAPIWLGDSLELAVHRMIAHCAINIHVPYIANYGWLRHHKIKSFLSSSAKKHILFIDQRHKLWDSIVAYLKPLTSALGENNELNRLAWAIYLIALSSKYKAEVVLNPKKTLSIIRKLNNFPELNAECHARLATLVGILNSFKEHTEGAYLRFLPNTSEIPLSERLKEIMEDAYLLEASRLRRFLGVKQNIVSINRDLRKILTYICKKRTWAKGIVGIGASMLMGGQGSAEAMDKLVELIPSLGEVGQQPVLTNIAFPCISRQEACAQIVRGISGENLYTFPQIKRSEDL